MDQLSSLAQLGGYGAYVWPAYGFAALVLIGLLIRSLAVLRAGERLLAGLQGAAPHRPARAAPDGARHEPAR